MDDRFGKAGTQPVRESGILRGAPQAPSVIERVGSTLVYGAANAGVDHGTVGRDRAATSSFTPPPWLIDDPVVRSVTEWIVGGFTSEEARRG